MVRTLLAVTAVLICGRAAECEHAPVPEDANTKLLTWTYELKPILGSKSATTKLVDADAVIRLILKAVKIGDLKPGTSGPQLVIRDGDKLEVTAGVDVHAEIIKLLETLYSLADLAIDIKVEVIELDPKDAEKLVEALPKTEKGRPKAPILFGGTNDDEVGLLDETDSLKGANKWLKAGKVIQTSTNRYASGIETTLSARHAIGTYYPKLNESEKPEGELQTVKDGFALTALPLVTKDRRFVRFRLTEQSTVFRGLKTREVRGFGDPGAVMYSDVSPDLADVGATGSAIVPDGGTVIFRLAYAPKDKVWVVVLKPTIFIQAEEDERQKQGKKP